MLTIEITADVNDGDYVKGTTKISAEDLEKIKSLINKIKNFTAYTVNVDGRDYVHRHNYPWGEYYPIVRLGEKPPHEIYGVDRELTALFEEFLPCSNMHTIDSIRVYETVNEVKLL